MTDTSTPTMGPNVRRFVRSAWLLLFAQLIAALFAIGATGWAAFYVADLRAERDALRAQVEEFTGTVAADPVFEDPATDDIEFVEEPLFDEDPVVVMDESTNTPTRTPDTAARPPVTTAPRPAPSRPTRPRTDAPTPVTQAPPRRNSTYPGGLPGEGSNDIEPPFVPGRFSPNAPSTATPTNPNVDLDGLVGQQYPDDQAPDRQPNDSITRDDQGPNFQRRN